MNKSLKICSVLFVLMLFVSTTRAQENNQHTWKQLKHIIDRMIKAYGGAKAIERTSAVRATGRNVSFMTGETGTYTRYFKRDRKLLVEIQYQTSSEKRVLNGPKGYRGVNNEPLVAVNGAPYLAMVYQYKYLDMVYEIMKGNLVITGTDKMTIDGREVIVMEVNDKAGPPIHIYVDLKNYRIFRASGFFSAGGKQTDLTADFSDFRKVNGVLMPFKIKNSGAGQKIGETVIEKMYADQKSDDMVFNVPDSN